MYYEELLSMVMQMAAEELRKILSKHQKSETIPKEELIELIEKFEEYFR